MLRMCSFCGDYGNKLIINEHSTFYFFMKNKGERQQETARLKFPKSSALELCIVLSAFSTRGISTTTPSSMGEVMDHVTSVKASCQHLCICYSSMLA